MDYILELILKNEDHQLDKILSEQATKRGSNPLELTMKNFEEMFVCVFHRICALLDSFDKIW